MKNVKEIEIELTSEWKDLLDKTLKKKISETSIDGFRKGKIPKDVYIQKFGIESLYMDSVDDAINVAYNKVLDEQKVVPVVAPKADIVNISDSKINIKLTIIEKPDVKLSGYKNLGVKKDKIEVSKKEIDDEINHLQQSMADIIVKENGAIEEGNIAIIDFDGFVDGEALDGGKGENYSLEIGSHTFIPGFEEGLIGHKTGEEIELKLKFPENYLDNLKGKDVLFKVKINEVKMRSLPKMDKTFFEDLGYDDVKNEDELRNKIKEELTHYKEHQVNDKFLEDCLSAASKNLTVTINPEIIDDEIDRMLHNFVHQLQMQGLNIDTYYQVTGMKEEDLRKQMSPEAEKKIKYRYLLEEIAEEEKFSFTKKEIDKRTEELAEMYQVTKEELLETFKGTDTVLYDLKMQKALDILRNNN